MTDLATIARAREELVLLTTVTPMHNGVAVPQYLASRTWVSAGSDSPAHTIFDGRILGGTNFTRSLGGVLGFSSKAAAGDVVLANADGGLDAWQGYAWSGQPIVHRIGLRGWALADFIVIFSGLVEGLSQNDQTAILALRDRAVELGSPIQTVPETRGTLIGGRCPITLGYPKNISPVIYDPDSSPEYRVHEAGLVEDPAVTRYINQAPSTSPGITKRPTNPDIEFNSDPGGLVTLDVKGAKPDGTWLRTPGECLKWMLTRSHSQYWGLSQGGGASTIVLQDDASDVDDYYNGKSIWKTVFTETGKGDREDRTISDYDGATRTVTVNSPWIDEPADGDAYRIKPETTRYGPLAESDLDTDAFDALDVAMPHEIGLYIDDGSSAADAIGRVLSPGAWHAWTTAGKLAVGVLPDPTASLIADAVDFSGYSNAWGGGVTLTTDAAAAPDGPLTANRLTRIDGAFDGINPSFTARADTRYQVRVSLRRETSARSRILVWDSNASAEVGHVEIGWAGQMPYTHAVSGGVASAAFRESLDGWWEVRFDFTTAATVTTHQVAILPATSSANGQSILAWGLYVESPEALVLTRRDIIGGIEVEQDEPPVYRLRVGYDRNWTPQGGGATDTINAARAAYVKREYLWAIREARGILADYPEARDIDVPTVFTDQSDVEAERDRLWSLFSVQRNFYRLTASAVALALNPGDVVRLVDSRHGLEQARRVVVVDMTARPMQGLVDLELWG